MQKKATKILLRFLRHAVGLLFHNIWKNQCIYGVCVCVCVSEGCTCMTVCVSVCVYMWVFVGVCVNVLASICSYLRALINLSFDTRRKHQRDKENRSKQ